MGGGIDGHQSLLSRQEDDPPAALRQVEVLLLELLEAVGDDRVRVEHELLAGTSIVNQVLRLAQPWKRVRR